jgi:hypothetical protein
MKWSRNFRKSLGAQSRRTTDTHTYTHKSLFPNIFFPAAGIISQKFSDSSAGHAHQNLNKKISKK